MLPPKNSPADSSISHPWIARLLNADASAAATAIRKRIVDASAFDSTTPLANWLADYKPRQIVFNRSIGYVACIKIENDTVVDMIYIPQPLSESKIAERVSYFHNEIRPLMTDFYKRYAGVGQEMEGVSGQFSFNHFPTAEDLAHYEPEKLGDWKTARLFYSAQNGDSVFINQNGATAWHVLETNQLIPLFDDFSGFINHFVGFRTSENDTFDSWSSCEFLKQTKNR